MNSKEYFRDGTVNFQTIPTSEESFAHLVEALLLEEKAITRLMDLNADEIIALSEKDEIFSDLHIDWHADKLLRFMDVTVQLMDELLHLRWMVLKQFYAIQYRIRGK